jgi:cbb3-type cytochrome oxidase subunit 3
MRNMETQLCYNLAIWLLAIIMVAVLVIACTYRPTNRRL